LAFRYIFVSAGILRVCLPNSFHWNWIECVKVWVSKNCDPKKLLTLKQFSSQNILTLITFWHKETFVDTPKTLIPKIADAEENLTRTKLYSQVYDTQISIVDPQKCCYLMILTPEKCWQQKLLAQTFVDP
jgi:hypothetical protein